MKLKLDDIKNPDARKLFLEMQEAELKGTTWVAKKAFVTTDPATKAMLDDAEYLSEKPYPVTIYGETGTGKELIAKVLHGSRSNRDGRMLDNFRAVNCAGIPDGLFESIMFGHVRGAFTGAIRDTPGMLVAAEGGTAFLDEIGEIPLHQQAKLLRALQTKRVLPVGGDLEIPINCRFVFATNRNLWEMVKAGTFREDLFFRITTFELFIKPLRDRQDDAIIIAKDICRRHGLSEADVVSVPVEVINSRGNVRQLERWVLRQCLLPTENFNNVILS